MKELFDWAMKVCPRAAGGTWAPVEHGGSDRKFWRGGGAAAGLVLVSYGTEKEENTAYARCARFLHARGVRVPEVLADDEAGRRLLMEDAGTEDLWTHRAAPWEVRRELYGRALEQAARLHALDTTEAAAAGVLREPFDAGLYQWEQDYFFQHFLGEETGRRLRAAVPLAAQAETLAARPRVPVHRDFQSQNVMIRSGEVKLIDFQGMRAGLAAYDVASLLFDPYVALSVGERAELSRLYLAKAGRSDEAGWEEELRAAARQRLMQALGAYGFLGRVKGKPAFLEHIPAAAERLAALCDEPAWQPLAEAVRAAAAERSPRKS
jgi:aminoglycoside/choline kinase family phosphotransferase